MKSYFQSYVCLSYLSFFIVTLIFFLYPIVRLYITQKINAEQK